MPRLPALFRKVRRPGPLLSDVALAVVLAAVSLLTVETSSGVQEPVSATGITGASLAPPPGDLRPGEAWNAEITLDRTERGGPPPADRPLLAIQNTGTGEWRTYELKPTGAPAVYRARVVFPAEGVYSYSIRGVFDDTVTIGTPALLPRPGPPSHVATRGSESSPVWQVILALVACLPIALRRRHPVSVLALTLAAAVAMYFLFDNFLVPGAVVALYTVAAHVGRPASARIALGTAAVLALPVATIVADAGVGNVEDGVAAAAIYGIFTAAWLLGDNVRTRRAYLRELEERATRLEREREANVRRAAAEEHARIARELHDIVAHNVSVMTVQAAAAGDVFETQPARAREALGSIEATGREALTELRRLLGRVRPEDGSVARAPQPGLAGVDALVEQVRAAGLAVELSVEGAAVELPPGIDLSAYRIVQEALTNALRHAQASRADVRVRYGPDALELEILDDGQGETANAADGGHGIIGMQERAALVGGDLDVGPRPGGGFGVRARIPLGR